MYLATVEKSRAGLSDQALRPKTASKFSRESSHGGHRTREKRRRAALAICCVSPVERPLLQCSTIRDGLHKYESNAAVGGS